MHSVKSDFPILQNRNIVYLDNAATTQKPRSVIDAIKEFYEYHNANIHRGLYPLAREATEMYEKAHETVAEFIGGRAEETVFVKNASEGLNLAAWILKNRLGRGDNVVVTVSEHHSNFLPWFKVAKMQGAAVKVAGTRADGSIDEEQVVEMIDRKTKIVAVQHASNVTGYITDLEEIVKAAHDSGAVVVADGAQSVPHVPVNVKKTGIDAIAFSAHKMLGPTGIGALWMRGELLEEGEPLLEGGDMIKEVHYDGELRVVYNEIPWKYEAGTPNIAGAVGFAVAVEYLKSYGVENVLPHEQKLARILMDGLEELGITWVGPKTVEKRGGVVTFTVRGMSSHAVALYLGTKNICVRAGYHCAQPLHESLGLKDTVRASVYIYNDKNDVDRLLAALEEIL